jgi:hypothetical protein
LPLLVWPLENEHGGARRLLLQNNDMRATTYGSIVSILKHGLDKAFIRGAAREAPLHHANIRGPDYYH